MNKSVNEISIDVYREMKYIVHEGGKKERTLTKGRKMKTEPKIEERKKFAPKKSTTSEKKIDSIRKEYMKYWNGIAQERKEEAEKYMKNNKERIAELK